MVQDRCGGIASLDARRGEYDVASGLTDEVVNEYVYNTRGLVAMLEDVGGSEEKRSMRCSVGWPG